MADIDFRLDSRRVFICGNDSLGVIRQFFSRREKGIVPHVFLVRNRHLGHALRRAHQYDVVHEAKGVLQERPGSELFVRLDGLL